MASCVEDVDCGTVVRMLDHGVAAESDDDWRTVPMGETTQEFLSVLENVMSASDRRTAWVHLDTVVHRWVTEMANAGAQCPCRSVTAKTDVSDAVESRHSTEDPPAVACPLNDYQQDTIGSILSDIKQTAVYCDEVPVAYRSSSFHNRVVMMTEYRLVVLPTGRPRLGKRAPIVSGSILQITSVDVNDNTVSVELGNGSILNVRQPERAESQFLTCLVERLQGVRRSWPDEERARLPSGCRYPDPSAADRDDVVGTYGAICDRDGIQGRSRFVDYLDRCRAQGDTTLNLRDALGVFRYEEGAHLRALSAVCTSLRYTADLFDRIDASNLAIGDPGVQAIASMMTGVSRVQLVNLSNVRCASRAMAALGSALHRQAPNWLRHLDVSNNVIGDKGMAHVMTALTQTGTRLKHLNCCRCGLGARAFEAIATYMSAVPSLETLNVSDNAPGATGLDWIEENLHHLDRLRVLRLGHCSGPGAQLDSILRHIADRVVGRLRFLDVSRNRLLNDAVLHVGACLRHTPTMATVAMADVRLTKQSATMLLENAASNGHDGVEFVLDLSGNDCPGSVSPWPDALQTMARATPDQVVRNVVALNLSSCGINPVEFIAVCKALESVPSLMVLDLGGNVHRRLFGKETGGQAGRALADLCNRNGNLKIVSVRGRPGAPMGAAAVSELVDGLMGNTTLTALNVSSNAISKHTYDLIVKLLVRSPNIRHVDLDGNRPAWPILQSFCDGLLSSVTGLVSGMPRDDLLHCVTNERTRDDVDDVCARLANLLRDNAARVPVERCPRLQRALRDADWIKSKAAAPAL
ncbi:unnamed protein product (mitochondrion) [Plasmodiophora brassicae]|uniref:CARMIL pleckstrin homology domain-containing protein n=2 Tax=Plasmodiophora brassicae TaxID=37360 RepID=A0A3P3Y9W1_PLABS|nr:unnamed protein product [Plasmodiophora brassicae]